MRTGEQADCPLSRHWHYRDLRLAEVMKSQ